MSYQITDPLLDGILTSIYAAGVWETTSSGNESYLLMVDTVILLQSIGRNRGSTFGRTAIVIVKADVLA